MCFSIRSEKMLPGSAQETSARDCWPGFGHLPVPELIAGNRNKLNIIGYSHCVYELGVGSPFSLSHVEG